MCTVTFIPRRTGYYLAMNRDEKRVRSVGLPPSESRVDGRTVVCPSEPGGGTWIAANDLGGCLALVNWYSVPERVIGNPVSRGDVIPSVITANSACSAETALATLPLDRFNPFRIIGVFPAAKMITEWRWNLRQLVRKEHPWLAQQWISSGFDEPRAQAERGSCFQQARSQRSSETLAWLRRLHRSHLPAAGPFSTCMHREDACTVSYTEIVVQQRKAALRYHPGSPCQREPIAVYQLQGHGFDQRNAPYSGNKNGGGIGL